MTRYLATIRHHSIARAPVIEIKSAKLSNAKARAAREFGQGFLDHEIVIYDATYGREPEVVTSRRIGSRRWQDR